MRVVKRADTGEIDLADAKLIFKLLASGNSISFDMLNLDSFLSHAFELILVFALLNTQVLCCAHAPL